MRRGVCGRCQRERMVNFCTRGNKPLGEFCGECWDKVDHDPTERNRRGHTSGPNHNDPGFDNVVRALEEDR